MKRALPLDGDELDNSEKKLSDPPCNDVSSNGSISQDVITQNALTSSCDNGDDDLDEESDEFVIDQLKTRRDFVQKHPEASIDCSSAVDVRFNPASKDMCVCFSNKLVLQILSDIHEKIDTSFYHTMSVNGRSYQTLHTSLVNESFRLENGDLTKTKEVKIRKFTPLEAVRYDSSGTYVYLISQDSLGSLQPDEDSPPDCTERLEDKPVVMSVGDTYIVVGTDNGKIHVFDVENMNLIFSMIMGHSQIESLIISGDKVFTISENQVCSVNMTTRLMEQEVDHSTDLLCGTEHNNSLACGSTSGEIVLFKLSNLTSQGSYSISKRNSVLGIVSINGSSAAVSLDNGHIKLYSLFPNAEIGIIGMVDTFSASLDVSSDGDWLVAKDNMSGFKLFNISFAKQKSSLCSKKRKKGRSNRHLPTSSFEDTNAFFSSLR